MDKTQALDRPVWEVLALEGDSASRSCCATTLSASPASFPLHLESSIYRMQINPLKSVSLASESQYIFVLTNMTTQAMQRQTLEHIVDETEDLHKEKAQLEEMNITHRPQVLN